MGDDLIDVETSVKEYHEDGFQLAEFDVVVSAKVGTTQIQILLEFRDRPSDGPQGGDWVEQLSGRKGRFNMSNTLTSKKGAAKMFSVSERTVDRMLAAGELTKLKIRDCVRIKVAEIKRLLGEEAPQ